MFERLRTLIGGGLRGMKKAELSPTSRLTLSVGEVTELVIVHNQEIGRSILYATKKKIQSGETGFDTGIDVSLVTDGVASIADKIRSSVNTVFFIHSKEFLDLPDELVCLLRDNRHKIAVISASPDMPKRKFFPGRVQSIRAIFLNSADEKWLPSTEPEKWSSSTIQVALQN